MIRPINARIGLWIDREPDTGHGLPVEICPGVIALLDHNDPRHYALQDGKVLGVSLNGIVVVPEHLEDLAIEAATEQPEENIHLHYVQVFGSEIVGFYQSDGSIEPWTRNSSLIPDGIKQQDFSHC